MILFTLFAPNLSYTQIELLPKSPVRTLFRIAFQIEHQISPFTGVFLERRLFQKEVLFHVGKMIATCAYVAWTTQGVVQALFGGSSFHNIRAENARIDRLLQEQQTCIDERNKAQQEHLKLFGQIKSLQQQNLLLVTARESQSTVADPDLLETTAQRIKNLVLRAQQVTNLVQENQQKLANIEKELKAANQKIQELTQTVSRGSS